MAIRGALLGFLIVFVPLMWDSISKSSTYLRIAALYAIAVNPELAAPGRTPAERTAPTRNTEVDKPRAVSEPTSVVPGAQADRRSPVESTNAAGSDSWADIIDVGRQSRAWMLLELDRHADGRGTAKFSLDNGRSAPAGKTLGVGDGVPLLVMSPAVMKYRGWETSNVRQFSGKTFKVIRDTSEDAVFRVHTLNHFCDDFPDRDGNLPPDFVHHQVWSDDGTYLYILTGNRLKKTISKLNTHSWCIECSFSTRDDVSGLALTSQGLLAVVFERATSTTPFGPGSPKLQYVPSEQRLAQYRGGMFLLDKNTLAVKGGWVSPRVSGVVGRSESDLAYLCSPRDALLVVNVEKGELLSVDTTHDLCVAPWQKGAATDLNFSNMSLSTDGKHLVTHGVNSVAGSVSSNSQATKWRGRRSVNRFDVSKVDIRWRQSMVVGGLRSKATRSADVGVSNDFLCFPDQQYRFVKADDFSASVAGLAFPRDGAVAMDSLSKSVYLCWPDWKSRQLCFRVLRGAADVETVLFEGIGGQFESETERNTRYASLALTHRNLLPYEMSAAPDGRGAIVFTPQAAYFVEVKCPPQSRWGFELDSNEVAEFAGATSLNIGSASNELALPDGDAVRGMSRDKAATAHLYNPYQGSMGTAFCISDDGLFLTTATQVREVPDDGEIKLTVHAGSPMQRVLSARVVRTDSEENVAMLKVSDPSGLVWLPLGTAEGIDVTTRLTAYGYRRIEELDIDAGRYSSVRVIRGTATRCEFPKMVLLRFSLTVRCFQAIPAVRLLIRQDGWSEFRSEDLSRLRSPSSHPLTVSENLSGLN
ncbi:MAG: serine protease [Pirellulaceae bacterium]